MLGSAACEMAHSRIRETIGRRRSLAFNLLPHQHPDTLPRNIVHFEIAHADT
ncbi:MAG: hypothetical protein RIR26_2214, partial [Pseudomonadota bacterium]